MQDIEQIEAKIKSSLKDLILAIYPDPQYKPSQYTYDGRLLHAEFSIETIHENLQKLGTIIPIAALSQLSSDQDTINRFIEGCKGKGLGE